MLLQQLDMHESASILPLAPGASLLTGFALDRGGALLDEIQRLAAQSPFRQMSTPGGFRMSAAMTNCGAFGWITDGLGYRYDTLDPLTTQPWPRMPASFEQLAHSAALAAGFDQFAADACLINRYAPGARMTLHQDKDERDFSQPIVSVSLGLATTFLFGGRRRADAVARVAVTHGDVVVWGGPDRLRYHGVRAIKKGTHPLAGEFRYNLTFRRAR